MAENLQPADEIVQRLTDAAKRIAVVNKAMSLKQTLAEITETPVQAGVQQAPAQIVLQGQPIKR